MASRTEFLAWAHSLQTKSYYEILGVATDAMPEAIQEAFHAFALRCHPDQFVDDGADVVRAAADVFKRGVEAYEILTQAGFGFRRNLAAGAASAMLIESVRKFRLALATPTELAAGLELGPEYVDMVEEGVVAAQYISNWQLRPAEAVLLVPAYTFLMMSRPVRVQFWLDAGSSAWHERIFQPLTHPYVLQRGWPPGAVWTDEDEVRARDEALSRLILGLSRRCRERVYLAYCGLNERGYEQQGPLLRAVQRLLRLHSEAAQ